MHPLDTALALEPLGAGRWRGRTSPAWQNMVGPFGGITAAQALVSVLRDERRLGEPVALTVNFCAALADGAFEVEAQPARTNRSTQHWTVALRQGGQTLLTGTAITALRRPTWSADEVVAAPAPPPQEVAPLAATGAVEWLNRYSIRFVAGGFPAAWDGQDGGDSRSLLWVQDAPPRPLDYAALTAMADVFYPRIWRRRAWRVPIGTVTLSVYYHADAERLAQAHDAPLLGQASAQSFYNGYFDQSAQLWSEAGVLLATTHQLVYYKE
ncbi:MAG TPA: thioesterase family protein [Burkholderiaceae bacterium]|jgi:acyl-CoA thioesterase|nr:thioesterase family protein [Burkholderiaceae bacterium]